MLGQQLEPHLNETDHILSRHQRTSSHELTLEERARRYAHAAGMDADPATRTNGSRFRHNPFVNHPDVVSKLTLSWLLHITPTSQSLLCHRKPNSNNLLATIVDKLVHDHYSVHSGNKGNKSMIKDQNVYLGTAGLALVLYKIHLSDPGAALPGGRSLMDVAIDLLSYITLPLGISNVSSMNTTSIPDPNHVGLLDSTLGTTSVASRISLHAGMVDYNQNVSDSVLEMATRYACLPHTGSELLYGRAGLLSALQLIDAPSDTLAEIVEAIIEDGLRTARSFGLTSQCPLLWSWHGKLYLGAAHGAAGILTQLLKLPLGVIRPYLTNILATMNYLGSLDGYPIRLHCNLDTNDNFIPIYGTRGPDDTEVVVQWCHGVVGFGLMWLAAWRTLGPNSPVLGTVVERDLPDEWLDRAKVCGSVTWHRGLIQKHVGLCHGIAGNAYLFLQLWSATGEIEWYHRALSFAAVASHWHGGRCDHPSSVYEGIAGLAWLLADLTIVDRYLGKLNNATMGSPTNDSQNRPWIEFPAFVAPNLDVTCTWSEVRRRVRTISSSLAVISSNHEVIKPERIAAMNTEELRDSVYQ